jgi:hypothetical protein
MMANLLLDAEIRAKIETITGALDDLWLKIAWDLLINQLGYDPSFQANIEEIKEGINTRYLFMKRRPVITLNKVYLNENELELANFSVYEDIAVKGIGIFTTADTIYSNVLGDYNSRLDYKIDYDAGYTNITFPDSLIYAVSLMIQNTMNNSSEQGQLSSYKIDTISYTFKTFIEQNAGIQLIFDKYRGF